MVSAVSYDDLRARCERRDATSCPQCACRRMSMCCRCARTGGVHATIEKLEIRQRTGMTIVAIVRGCDAIPMPGPDAVLRSGDRLVVVERREDSARLTSLIEG